VRSAAQRVGGELVRSTSRLSTLLLNQHFEPVSAEATGLSDAAFSDWSSATGQTASMPPVRALLLNTRSYKSVAAILRNGRYSAAASL